MNCCCVKKTGTHFTRYLIEISWFPLTDTQRTLSMHEWLLLFSLSYDSILTIYKSAYQLVINRDLKLQALNALSVCTTSMEKYYTMVVYRDTVSPCSHNSLSLSVRLWARLCMMAVNICKKCFINPLYRVPCAECTPVWCSPLARTQWVNNKTCDNKRAVSQPNCYFTLFFLVRICKLYTHGHSQHFCCF